MTYYLRNVITASVISIIIYLGISAFDYLIENQPFPGSSTVAMVIVVTLYTVVFNFISEKNNKRGD